MCSSDLGTGESLVYNIGVNAGQQLRISLVWSDYPGDPAAAKMLVNDLDLTVTGPGVITYKGNVFTGGQSITGGLYDNLNNVEGVYLNAPTAGIYKIKINGTSVAIGPQNFALVISGGIDPGYGLVSMDRTSYTAPDTIKFRVEDSNNTAGTASVTLTSSGSGDSETMVLGATGFGSGVFTGSINTAFDVLTPGDGVLQVIDGDTVTASYLDGSPVHTSTFTALINTFGPMITNVFVDNIFGTSAIVHFTTNLGANTTVFWGTNPNSGTWVDVKGNNLYGTDHSMVLTGLTMETLYYFDVSATTVRGASVRDTNGQAHYTFSTGGLATGALVLYVDDDDGTVASDGTAFDVDWGDNLDAYG